MQWNHLPVAGGIYDQHPKLLEEWSIIFAAIHKYERQEAEREKAKAKAGRRR